MPIRSSGPLPIQEIANEFGGSVPHGLSEYYGDGALLGNNYFPPSSVPNRGNRIRISDFYGKAKRNSVVVEIKSTTAGGDIYSYFKNQVKNSQIPVDATLIIGSGVFVGKSSLVNSPSDITKENSALFLNAVDDTRETSFKTGDTFTLINNGTIVGMGGAGGAGVTGTKANPAGPTRIAGQQGGYALHLGFNTTIRNSGVIASGGRGGTGGKGSYANKVLTNSWYNCGPAVVACTSWVWTNDGGGRVCAKASNQRGDCSDDRNITPSRCNGGAWHNNAITCGCGVCEKRCDYQCVQKCDERRGNRRQCRNVCERVKNCEDLSGRYYCACYAKCGSHTTYPSDSQKCPNTSIQEVFYTGGAGGSGRGIGTATNGGDSVPEALPECKGDNGGDFGSNTAIVGSYSFAARGTIYTT